jgi:hypothetical protein
MLAPPGVLPVKAHAGRERMRHQRGAHGLAGAVQQRQRVRRHAGVVQQRARSAPPRPGVCSAGLAATLLPATRAAATWPAKMASGKFHGRDADEHAAPALHGAPHRCPRLARPAWPARPEWPARPARPAARSSAGSPPLRAPRTRSRRASCALPCTSRRAVVGQLRLQRRRGAARARPRAAAAPACVPARRSRALQALHMRRPRRPARPRARAARRTAAPAASSGVQRRAVGGAGQVGAAAGCGASPGRRGRTAAAGCAASQVVDSGDASSSSRRHGGVGELVHEARVGAVFQQPSHQVGQQVAVLAHRRVDAAAATSE